TIEVTFLIDRLDSRGIEMTCVSHWNYAQWLNTHVAFRVIPDAGGTYLDLLHDGYPAEDGCHARCVEGWNYYLRSLKAYCETGLGMPQESGIASVFAMPS